MTTEPVGTGIRLSSNCIGKLISKRQKKGGGFTDREKRLRQKAMKLPPSPGVYIMKNSRGDIIYIGKAKALKNRVSSYFGSHSNHSLKVIRMVENVDDFDYILVGSEFEALILECSLIKQHKPKYNILLKDDKGYHYIRVTTGEWRTISTVLQKLDDGAEYLGPYYSSSHVRQLVDNANKIFRLPQCTKVFPRDIGKSRPCLNFFISQCSAPCAGKIKLSEYSQAVESALKYIVGGANSTVEELEKQMLAAAEALDFEKAAKLRDTIHSIKSMAEKQHVVAQRIPKQDVFAVATVLSRACLNVMRFDKGRLFDNEFFFFDSDGDLPGERKQLILSFYSMRDDIPPRISIDGETDDMELVERFLSEKAGRKVEVAVPVRGEQMKLIAMCRENAQEKLAQSRERTSPKQAACDELAELLALSAVPEFIESYDISHTAGSDNVAGMVVFRDGSPYKKGYRRFEIKGFEGQDDCRSMAQTVSRRLNEYEKHKDDGNTFGRLPDLILLDGGLQQVHAVREVLKEHGVDIPLFGMVKDSKHRTRAIESGGGEIAIDSKRRAFTLISEIQEEVHRFAVTYHRKKHTGSTLKMSLTEIEGIGEAKAKALLKQFKTIKAISSASTQELSAIKGISEKNAEKIAEYYSKNKDN